MPSGRGRKVRQIGRFRAKDWGESNLGLQRTRNGGAALAVSQAAEPGR